MIYNTEHNISECVVMDVSIVCESPPCAGVVLPDGKCICLN